MAADNLRLRQEAWAFGRQLRDDLVEQYRQEYGIAVPPPPAFIIDELLTDFLGAELHYDPLPKDRFAQTDLRNGRVVVTVNTRTSQISGVKDSQGVQNVAKWHEASHVVRDQAVLRSLDQTPLPGFGQPARIICYRRKPRHVSPSEWLREFRAEEAGRAAAVSHAALARSRAFRALVRAGGAAGLPNGEAWRLLYEAAADIGVNRTALVTQLRLEGWVAIGKEGGRNLLYVQPTLGDKLVVA